MSIGIYTNEDELNRRLTNTGKYLEPKDEFIISQNLTENTSFGLCDNDIIEFSVYDINNNLLVQNDGSSIRYIEYPNTLKYISTTQTNEIAVNVRMLLEESGFSSGLLKANINFVRKKAGDASSLRRFYIQEISATRQEIRVAPLVVLGDTETTDLNLQDVVDMQELNVDNTTYLAHINQVLSTSETIVAQQARQYLDELFPEVDSDYIEMVLRQDFGMNKDLDSFIVSIYKNIQELVRTEVAKITESSCDVVPASELDAKMSTYILQSVGSAVAQLNLQGPILSTGPTAGDTVESNSEKLFETAFNIATQGISENTIEYTQTDLSSIKVNNTNIDNFAVLQQQLTDKINGVVSSTATEGSTTDTATDTGTPTRNNTVPTSSTEDTTPTPNNTVPTSSTEDTTPTTLRGDRTTVSTTTTTTTQFMDGGSSGTGRLG
jgi:hypothetical protein